MSVVHSIRSAFQRLDNAAGKKCRMTEHAQFSVEGNREVQRTGKQEEEEAVAAVAAVEVKHRRLKRRRQVPPFAVAAVRHQPAAAPPAETPPPWRRTARVL